MVAQNLRLLCTKNLTSCRCRKVYDRIVVVEIVHGCCWNWDTSRTWVMSAALTEKQGELVLVWE